MAIVAIAEIVMSDSDRCCKYVPARSTTPSAFDIRRHPHCSLFAVVMPQPYNNDEW
jgi:hypothetical protein